MYICTINPQFTLEKIFYDAILGRKRDIIDLHIWHQIIETNNNMLMPLHGISPLCTSFGFWENPKSLSIRIRLFLVGIVYVYYGGKIFFGFIYGSGRVIMDKVRLSTMMIMTTKVWSVQRESFGSDVTLLVSDSVARPKLREVH